MQSKIKINTNSIFNFVKYLLFFEILVMFLFKNSSFQFLTTLPNVLMFMLFIILTIKVRKIKLEPNFIQIPFITYFIAYLFILILSFQYFAKDVLYHASLIVTFYFLFSDFKISDIKLTKYFDYLMVIVISILLIVNIIISQKIYNFSSNQIFNLFDYSFQRQYSFILSPELAGTLYILLYFIINKLKINILVRWPFIISIFFGLVIFNSKTLYAAIIIAITSFLIFKLFSKLKLNAFFIFMLIILFSSIVISLIDDFVNYLEINKIRLAYQYGYEIVNNSIIRLSMYEYIIDNFSLFTMDKVTTVITEDRDIITDNLESVLLTRIKLYGGIFLIPILATLYQISIYIGKKLIMTASVMTFTLSLALGTHSFPNIIFIYLCLYVLIYENNYKNKDIA